MFNSIASTSCKENVRLALETTLVIPKRPNLYWQDSRLYLHQNKHLRYANSQPIPTSGKAVRKRKKLVPDNVPSLIRKVTMGLLSPWEAWLKPPMLAWSGFALVLTDYLYIIDSKGKNIFIYNTLNL